MDDLTAPELRQLTSALLAPALWSWAIVLSEMGLRGAVEACRARDLPCRVFDKLSSGGWKGREVASLPTYDDVLDLVLAARIKAKMLRTKKCPKGRTVREAAHELDVTVEKAARALETFDRLAGPMTRKAVPTW